MIIFCKMRLKLKLRGFDINQTQPQLPTKIWIPIRQLIGDSISCSISFGKNVIKMEISLGDVDLIRNTLDFTCLFLLEAVVLPFNIPCQIKLFVTRKI